MSAQIFEMERGSPWWILFIYSFFFFFEVIALVVMLNVCNFLSALYVLEPAKDALLSLGSGGGKKNKNTLANCQAVPLEVISFFFNCVHKLPFSDTV